jgi:hypothetical protein
MREKRAAQQGVEVVSFETTALRPIGGRGLEMTRSGGIFRQGCSALAFRLSRLLAIETMKSNASRERSDILLGPANARLNASRFTTIVLQVLA